jgi:MOSC domain-containing protein YiiM
MFEYSVNLLSSLARLQSESQVNLLRFKATKKKMSIIYNNSGINMKVLGLFAAQARPLGPKNMSSGIDKRLVASVEVTELGIINDIQVDKRFHGGPERALHQYALSGYETIIKRHPLLHKRAIAGSIGENISSPVMNDNNVNIGDIYRIGGIEVQVSSPRIPCWKIEEKLKQKGLVQLIKTHQITGWYYRVLKGGVIRLSDEISLIQRPNANTSVASFVKQHFDKNATAASLRLLSDAQGLDPQWQAKLLGRIELNSTHKKTPPGTKYTRRCF